VPDRQIVVRRRGQLRKTVTDPQIERSIHRVKRAKLRDGNSATARAAYGTRFALKRVAVYREASHDTTSLAFDPITKKSVSCA
jgi:hypothetical protein